MSVAAPPPPSQILVMPMAGESGLLHELERVPAASGVSIDVNVYELTDGSMMHYLAQAAAAGASVRLLLDAHPYGGQREVRSETAFCDQQPKISCHWSNARFTFDHAKYAVVGDRLACIGTANWTHSAFTGNREYIDCTVEPAIVTAAAAVFQSDWTGVRAGAISRQNLILSPGALGPIETLLGQGGHLGIEMEEIGSIQRINTLIAAHGAGARVIAPCSELSGHPSIVGTWRRAGVKVRCLTKPYIHAKLILLGPRAFLGSQNLTRTSLEHNREVGLLLTNRGLVTGLWQVFESDWTHAHE